MPVAAASTSHGSSAGRAARNWVRKNGMNAAMPSANPRGPKRRTYTAATVTATNTASATTWKGASSVPTVIATAAGPSMSSVVVRRRRRPGSFTARLLIIASTAAKITRDTGWPVSVRTQDITATASTIDAEPIAASRSRSSPGSIPVTAVRTSAHHTPRIGAVSRPARVDRQRSWGEHEGAGVAP
jgi:hypothetical protein